MRRFRDLWLWILVLFSWFWFVAPSTDPKHIGVAPQASHYVWYMHIPWMIYVYDLWAMIYYLWPMIYRSKYHLLMAWYHGAMLPWYAPRNPQDAPRRFKPLTANWPGLIANCKNRFFSRRILAVLPVHHAAHPRPLASDPWPHTATQPIISWVPYSLQSPPNQHPRASDPWPPPAYSLPALHSPLTTPRDSVKGHQPGWLGWLGYRPRRAHHLKDWSSSGLAKGPRAKQPSCHDWAKMAYGLPFRKHSMLWRRLPGIKWKHTRHAPFLYKYVMFPIAWILVYKKIAI